MTKTKPDTANQTHVLDINPRARIVADNRQWIIQVRAKAKAKWKPKHFINSTRGVLLMVMDENSIHPTDAGKEAIFALPNTYRAWADEHLKSAA
jgi:hypothetical protein